MVVTDWEEVAGGLYDCWKAVATASHRLERLLFMGNEVFGKGVWGITVVYSHGERTSEGHDGQVIFVRTSC